MILAVIGAHGVGKSTFGRRLATRLGLPFDPELGAQLAVDPAWRAPGSAADRPQSAFDAEVLRREVARDRARVGPRVVETWHPGNLAYAARRSPHLVDAALPAIRAVLRDAVVIPLLAPPHELARRASEPGDPAFFEAVGHAGAVWAGRLGLPVTRPLWTHQTPPDQLVDEAIAAIEELTWTACT